MTKGPGRDFANFSLVSVIRRWSSARELGIELFLVCWKGAMQREISGRRVMRIMEGQGVEGHVGDESSPKRNAFVRVFENVSLSSLFSSLFFLSLSFSFSFSLSSPLSLSGLVLSCGVCVGVCVCWRVCVLAQHVSLRRAGVEHLYQHVSLRRAGVQQLYQEQRMIGGIGNMLFSTDSQTLNV